MSEEQDPKLFEAPIEPVVMPRQRLAPPSDLMEQQRRSQKLMLLVLRLLFMVMLVTVTVLTIASKDEQSPEQFQFAKIVGLFLATSAVGVIVLVVDAKMPN